jgi:phosphoribosylformylglycinamidine cyclo-ligase
MTTYRDAGVDIEAGEEAVERIGPMARKTFTDGVLDDIGAFGAFFEPDFSQMERPVLVSSVDGVGTKALVAKKAGRFDTVGRDLVNHCVNDIAVCGAQPLFFLDYVAAGTLKPDRVAEVARGFAEGCKENGCALIGGETAEMPDIYDAEDVDLVGAITGMVDKKRILGPERVEAGDVLLGLPSTGLHTNGYTLARTVLFEHFDLGDAPDALEGETVGDALLAVHRSYFDAIRALVEDDLAHAFAHVTGGGLPGNLARVVSEEEGLAFDVDYEAWARPPLFRLIQERGDVPEADLRRTFNLGIGLVAVVPDARADAAREAWEAQGEHPRRIGRVTAAESR